MCNQFTLNRYHPWPPRKSTSLSPWVQGRQNPIVMEVSVGEDGHLCLFHDTLLYVDKLVEPDLLCG